MRLTHLFRLAHAFLFTALWFACVAMGQTETATVSGLITDDTGAVVAGADVKLQSVDRGTVATATTNDAGIYVFASVHPGQYQVTVHKPGFKQVDLLGMVVNVQDHIEQNFRLQIGSVAESVTVTGGAPLVNTQDGSVSTVVDRQLVENMPLNGRSFQPLIALSPGVVLTPSTFSEQGQFSVNGQRPDANYFTVDGVSANFSSSVGASLAQTAAGSLPASTIAGSTTSLVSIDAMQEFRVQTSTFAPEFGRTPGAQVSIVTRSGTNTFHGTAFEYLRNDVLDARDWFVDRDGLPKPKERQNDFGGVFGGPILRNKTFFFFSYEGLRLRQPNARVTVVPNLASRQAASAALIPYLAAFPVPNGPDLGNGFAQFAGSYSAPSTVDAASLRIDHNFGSRVTLFGRVNYAPSSGQVRGSTSSIAQLSSNAINKLNTYTSTIGSTQILSQTIVNDVRFNYSVQKERSVQVMDGFGGSTPVPASAYTPTGIDPSQSSIVFQITGAGPYAAGPNSSNESPQVNVVDNLSWSVRSHQFKFGVDYRDLRPLDRTRAYNISPIFSGINGATGVLAGKVSSVTVRGNQNVRLSIEDYSIYAQDNWKITPRLTLTYGFRWDIDLPPLAQGSTPLAALQNISSPTTVSLAPRGTALYSTQYGNVAPRVGVAYQLRATEGWQTVLRGGVGTFYDLGIGSEGQSAGFYPFQAARTLTGVSYPLSSAQATPPPFGSVPPPAGTIIYGPDPDIKTPKTYQWNVSLEQGLGAAQSLTASYVGAAGRDLLSLITYSSPNSALSGTTVDVTTNGATLSYNALQLEFRRRMAHGLQAQAAYTWAHSIDHVSTDNSGGLPPSFSNLKLNRGNSSFDIRHSMNAAISYDIPYPKGGFFSKAFLRQWSVDTYLLARSAPPVDLIGTPSVSEGFQILYRPNVVPGVPFYLYGPSYAGGKVFNKAAFTPAAAGQQGNLGRNVLRAFGASQVNFAVRRQFQLRERTSLQFRADFFNLFNHPNFGLPTGLLLSPLFGEATQTLGQALGGLSPLYQIGGARSVQLAMRLQF